MRDNEHLPKLWFAFRWFLWWVFQAWTNADCQYVRSTVVSVIMGDVNKCLVHTLYIYTISLMFLVSFMLAASDLKSCSVTLWPDKHLQLNTHQPNLGTVSHTTYYHPTMKIHAFVHAGLIWICSLKYRERAALCPSGQLHRNRRCWLHWNYSLNTSSL